MSVMEWDRWWRHKQQQMHTESNRVWEREWKKWQMNALVQRSWTPSSKLVNIVFAVHLNYVHIHPFHYHTSNLKRSRFFLTLYALLSSIFRTMLHFFRTDLVSFFIISSLLKQALLIGLTFATKPIAQSNITNRVLFAMVIYYRSTGFFCCSFFFHFLFSCKWWKKWETLIKIDNVNMGLTVQKSNRLQ